MHILLYFVLFSRTTFCSYILEKMLCLFDPFLQGYTWQARSKLKWSGRAKHCMAQLKACVSTVLLGGTGGTPPRKMYKFDALKSLLRPSGSKNRTVAETT